MFGTRVNPAAIRPDDVLVTKSQVLNNGDIKVIKTKVVRRVEFCSTPEKVHLDGECYDTRFSTVIVPLKD